MRNQNPDLRQTRAGCDPLNPSDGSMHARGEAPLRIVGRDADPAMAHPYASAAPGGIPARCVPGDVAQENASAAVAGIDARWVLAARVYALLEGARLTPESRERVLRTARALGIRPFDASVIIALVQDRARRGEGPIAVWPLLEACTPGTEPRPPRHASPARFRLSASSIPFLGAAVVGVIGAALMARWIVAG